MLDQVRLADALDAHRIDHPRHALPLVEAREDQPLLVVGLAVDVLGLLALL
ncbi:hypothetical protein D3C81_2326710 [compost metagenome]